MNISCPVEQLVTEHVISMTTTQKFC